MLNQGDDAMGADAGGDDTGYDADGAPKPASGDEYAILMSFGADEEIRILFDLKPIPKGAELAWRIEGICTRTRFLIERYWSFSPFTIGIVIKGPVCDAYTLVPSTQPPERYAKRLREALHYAIESAVSPQ